jgi:hypothetical protein
MKRQVTIMLLLVIIGVWLAGCTIPMAATLLPSTPSAVSAVTDSRATVEATVAATAAVVSTVTAKAPAAATPSPNATSAATLTPEPTAVPISGPVAWQADGVINAGEYANKGTFGPLTVYWSNDDTYLYLALEATTQSWLSIGLDYTRGMAGANYIIGAIIGGQVVIQDNYGTGRDSHAADTDLGGTDDIAASGGSYTGGVTRLEVQIPLNSGDQYDKPLSRGQTVPVILAVGSGSDLTSMHTFAGYGQIKLD